jgi:hypothetical protein
MTSEKQFYVYVHRKATDGSVFYVGKGGNDKFKRAYNKSSRSTFWKRTDAKYNRTVDIVFISKDEICAFSIEMALIKFYGRSNLCNLTDGGEGTSGRVASAHQRLKCSASNKGTAPSLLTMNAAIAKNSKPIMTKCGMLFSSASEAARFLRPDNFRSAKCGIAFCARGGMKTAYGYEWRYI